MLAGAASQRSVSQRWVFIMTVAFLYGAAVLRSLLAFSDGRRELALLLLLVWLVLFLAEPALSGLWRPYFVVNVALQGLVVGVLLSLSDSSDFFAILLAIPSMQAMQRWEPRRTARLIALFAVIIAVSLVNEYGPSPLPRSTPAPTSFWPRMPWWPSERPTLGHETWRSRPSCGRPTTGSPTTRTAWSIWPRLASDSGWPATCTTR